MRIVLIALAAIAVLGGGAAGAYFYFLNPAEASISEEHAENLEADKKTKKAKKEKKEAYEFVELDPLVLPIVDSNGVSQVVSLVIALEVGDDKAKKKIETMSPKLKSAFIQDLYGALNRHAALKGGVLQVSYLKKRLNKAGVKVLGDDVIQDVLLQVVQQRPI